MLKDDARKLDHATLEALRIRAVRSVQDGESPKDVARTLRVTARAMYRRVPATARVIRDCGEVNISSEEASPAVAQA